MNAKYIDYVVTADSVLDGAALADSQGIPRSWVCAHAHEDSTFEVTSRTMFDEDGVALDAELITLAAGTYYYMNADKITHKTGKVSYYRNEAY